MIVEIGAQGLAAHEPFPPRPLARLGEVAGLQLEQVGELPDQPGLVRRQLAIGQNHAPHQLRQHHFLAQVVLGRDQAGELVVVDGLPPLRVGQGDQLA